MSGSPHPDLEPQASNGPAAHPEETSQPPSVTSQPVQVPAYLGQSVIPIVNKLQDIFAQLGTGASTIDLPQVAVVGSQSSGKSSVLEALVGRDFLPRGSDICTRRPLVLQLVQNPRGDDQQGDVTEWGEFLHVPGKRFTDFDAIRKEILAETEREVGPKKGISEKQIRLKIFSPHVLNITLVDLPGITKVPVGDQPTDIEARIRTMILSYIKHETCIILAVSPANSDLANSDALQMARVADPDGSRTIGVITKLDIMDRGTDARNFLLGNIIPLKLGYIGVVNRSQEDINNNKSIRDALQYEDMFFRNRPVYHSLSDRCGVQQLARKLNAILVRHIQTILPDLRARINTQMVTLQKELVSYGEVTDSKSGQGALLLGILNKYAQAFMSVVEGKNQEMSTLELSGGARVHYIFQAIFVKSLEEIDPTEDLGDEDIQTAIQNATGPRSVLFVPEVPFEMLVRRQIEKLLEPSLQCARFVYDELVKISHRCEPPDLHRFPVLKRKVEEVVANFLREGLAPAETMIGHLIEMEMDYINTSNPNFIGGSRAVQQALQEHRGVKEAAEWKDTGADRLPLPESKPAKARGLLARSTPSPPPVPTPDHSRRSSENSYTAERPSTSGGIPSTSSWGISSIFSSDTRELSRGREIHAVQRVHAEPLEHTSTSIILREPPAVLRASDPQTEQEAIEISVTRVLLRSYYDIVRKNVQDLVPKAVMHFLVNHSKRELHNIFIRKLYRENLFDELLQEREEVAQKRKRCKEILKVLQQAAWTLEELPLDSTGGLDVSNLSLSSNGYDSVQPVYTSYGGSSFLAPSSRLSSKSISLRRPSYGSARPMIHLNNVSPSSGLAVAAGAGAYGAARTDTSY